MNYYQVKKILPIGVPSFFSGAAYYKNSVYVFGGRFPQQSTHYSYQSNCARRFDLIKNLWFSLAPMPEDNSFSSCATFKDSIIFLGKGNSEIIKYDLFLESYSIISSIKSHSDGSKILLTDNQRVWIIESIGRIIESEIENEYIWKDIGRSRFSAYQNHFVTLMEQIFYISLYTTGNDIKFYKFEINKNNKNIVERIGAFDKKLFSYE